MFVSLQIAYWVIYGLLAILGITVITILAIKISKRQKEKRTQKCLQKFQEYLDTIQSDLRHKERLPMPDQPLNTFEKKVMQNVLLDWMANTTSAHRRKLERLCEDLGLVELNLKQLKSTSHTTQIDAAYKLGIMRATEATAPLFQLFYRNKRDSTLFIIARSIAQTANQPSHVKDMILYLSEDYHNNYALLIDIAQDSSLDLTNVYNQLLKEKRPVLIKVALLGLMDQAQEDLHSQVLPLITSEDKEIRELTVRLLTQLGECSSSEIQKFIHFKDPEIRAFMAEWIGDSKQTEYAKLLEESIQDHDWTVARSSARSLLKLGDWGFETLCTIAKSEKTGSDIALECLHEDLNIQASKDVQTKQSTDYDRKLHVFQKHFGDKQNLNPAM